MAAIGLSIFITVLITTPICVSSSEPETGGQQCGFGMELILAKLEQLELKMALLEQQNRNLTDLLTSSPKMVTGSVKSDAELGAEPNLLGETIESCSKASLGTSEKVLLKPTETSKPFYALCESNSHGKGWMVIQSRFNGSESFYRNWTEYKNGFGSLDGEFWFGLDRIHIFTANSRHEIMFEFADFNQQVKHARYNGFRIGGEADEYAIALLGPYTGTAGDSLDHHRGMKFSTFDRDNDNYSGSCAMLAHGAWWYNSCMQSNLNGKYTRDRGYEAMSWNTFHVSESLQWCKVMIREV